MAVFNNGSITATVTPPQGYTGSYSYELFKYENNTWVTVNGVTEGFEGAFINPITKNDTTHTFGNPGGFDENAEGSGTWVGLVPAQYKVVVTTLTGLTCEVEGTATVGADDPTDPCYGFNISASVDSDTAITVTVIGGTGPFIWTLNGSGASPAPGANGTFTFSGLTPSTFYTIGVVDDNACTDSTTATTTGTADPEFTCFTANFQVADGVEGETIQIGVDATVDTGTLNSVSPSTYSPGTNIYTANITVPSTGYSNSGATITTCTDTASGNTVDPCSSFAAGVTSAVANETSQGANDGTMTITVNAGTAPFDLELDGGAATYELTALGSYTFTGLAPGSHTVVVTDDNNCTDTETKTVGAATDLCVGFIEGQGAVEISNITDASVQGASDGSITVLVGFVGQQPYELNLNSGQQTQTLNGAGQYQFTGLAAGNYTIEVTDDNLCVVNLTATVADGVDPCANFNGIQVTAFTNPTFGGATNGSITVEVLGGSGSYTWTLDGNAATPTDNGDGTFTFTGLSAAEGAGTQYSIVLTDASCGTDNTQQTLVDPGTPPGGNTTWYWFHGLDTNWLSAGSSYYLTNAPQFGMFTNGANVVVTQDLSVAMQHYFDNQTSITGGKDILTIEFAGPITGTSQEFVFNALSSGTGDYYLMVPATTDFPEDLTTAGICEFPAPGIPQNVPQKANVTVNGEDYILYLMPGSADGGSRTLAFA